MTATTLYRGHGLAAELNAQTAAMISRLGRAPRCAVLHRPDDPATAAYTERQRRMAAALGIEILIARYEASPPAVLDQLARLRDDPMVDAVVTLHPLPAGVNPLVAATALGPDKDADGQHPLNLGRVVSGDARPAPATARACAMILSRLVPDCAGVEIVLVGASARVGRPLANLLLEAGATVTVCHAGTAELAAHTMRAAVVVSAAGVPGLIGANAIREGAILLDVAVVRVGDRLVGDVELASVTGKAALVSHVPDGVGPVTTACLLHAVARIAGAGA